MVKLQIYYTTKAGVKKYRNIPYVNSAKSGFDLKEFALALYNLSDNEVNEIYRIQKVNVYEDETVETIQSGKLDPELSLSAYEITAGLQPSTINVTRLGSGAVTCTVTNETQTTPMPGMSTVDVNVRGTAIDITGNCDGTATVRVDVAETDDYKAASAVINVTVSTGGGGTDPLDPTIDPTLDPIVEP